MDHHGPVPEQYAIQPWYPGLFFIVPCSPSESILQTRIHLAIMSSQFRPPGFIRGYTQRRLWTMPPRRAVSGTVQQLLPILNRLSVGDINVVNALLCYTRGDTISAACDDCLEHNGPLPLCVNLSFTFRERCANCILNLRTNCAYALRRTPETDDDYMPDPGLEGSPSLGDPQRNLRRWQRRSRQIQREREEANVGHEEHVRRRPRWRGSGSALDPFDLT